MTDTNDAKEKVTQDIKAVTQEIPVQEKPSEEQGVLEQDLPQTSTVKAKVTDATFKSTSVALIEKLLQFSTPRLDSKIVNVLFLEGNNTSRNIFLFSCWMFFN